MKATELVKLASKLELAEFNLTKKKSPKFQILTETTEGISE